MTVGTNLVKFGFENPASALVPVDEGEPYDYEGNYTEGHDEEEVQFYYAVYINYEVRLMLSNYTYFVVGNFNSAFSSQQ